MCDWTPRGSCAVRQRIRRVTDPDVYHLGGELLAAEGAAPDHEHFVQPERLDGPETVRVIIDQGRAIGDGAAVGSVRLAF